MRPARKITAKEENFRTEPAPGTDLHFIKCDPVKPEPEGTIVLVPFQVTEYDQDCDGSLLARLKAIDKDGKATGWKTSHHGLCPSTDLVVTPEELKALFEVNCNTIHEYLRLREALQRIASHNGVQHGYGYTGCACHKIAEDALSPQNQ